MLFDTLKEDIKVAMRAKDNERLTTLRSITSACTNELVAQKKKPSDSVDDEMALTVITRLAKQRKDSAEQFRNGGRPELAESEERELAILQEYLPEQLSMEEIVAVVEAKKTELGISEKSDANKLMGMLMKDLKGRADGNDVKKAVNESFA
ncbi:MAG: GatB/YqeY domain-containing protein [Parcubacteria group bacterium]|nr:GatB/YqeY domain-containing protein [Parcubacteria group bacterium]